MFSRYFEEELAFLRDLGPEFAKAHPDVARMLSGPSADPDVERLLEGVAFLTGMMRERLEDDFPEIIHELTRMIFPHYLRPVPSATIIAFRPKPTLMQSMTVETGTQIASKPVDGTPCIFETCYDTEVHPLNLREAAFVQEPGKPAAIQVDMEYKGYNLDDWKPETLRVFLGGDYQEAANLYLLLCNHLREVVLSNPNAGTACRLPAEFVTPVGFDLDREGLMPYPSHAFPAYRLLQEYFILPQKYLFIDIKGWKAWADKGEGDRLSVRFVLDPFPFPPPKIKREHFVLSATPAVNIFEHDADPIRLDHRKTEYLVRPSGTDFTHYMVYGVEEVKGFIQGTAQERTYAPFEAFTSQGRGREAAVYQVMIRRSPVGNAPDTYLAVTYPPESAEPVTETLSIRLRCSNGALPENIRKGDICLPTGNTPEFIEFENLIPPTPSFLPPLGNNLLWRLISHLSLNYTSLATAENLRSLLRLYLFEDLRDRKTAQANRRRIEGIREVESVPADRLQAGIPMRGRRIRMRVSRDHFSSLGDLYLFGSVLEYFLGVYASLNTYTELVVEETEKGDEYRWPPRIGEQHLI